ncbi:TlpA disulfide reductase family protein [Aureispira sp. CCB-QB1]|uniref:TlpA disulfide reductase family protein n=1 Tax=Aureispira sp. CCB-QB1 TaxID=1313421 RepID=UPI0006966DE6|nr:TlpA disulfide reductase family protein [Aureispira sp. CCB-QB1]
MIITNKIYFIFIFSILLLSCESKVEDSNATTKEQAAIKRVPNEIVSGNGVSVGVYDYDHFKSYLEANNDTTYVINFWATWCKPCVEELPYFEQLYQNYRDKNVRLILVSLDFEDKIDSKLIPFMEQNQLKGEVLVLKQQGMNDWIDKINPTWSGALPATLIYNQKKRAFFEQSFEYEALETQLKEFL